MSQPSRLARSLATAACLLGIAAPAAHSADPGVIALPVLAAPAAGQSAPVLATDASNVTYAAWAEGSPDRVSWAQYSYGGAAFSAPSSVAPSLDPDDPAATTEFGPLIASDGAGNVTVAWTADTAAGTSLLAATKLTGASAFGPPVRIAPASDIVESPQLFMGDDGSTTLTWTAGVDTFHQRAAIRTSPGGPFGAPFDVYADGGIADEVAGGRDGTVAFGRTQLVDGPPEQNVVLVVRKSRGAASLDAPIELGRGDRKEYGPQDPTRVAVSDAGVTWASSTTWQGSSGRPTLWQAEAGGSFTNRCGLDFRPFSAIDVDSAGRWIQVSGDGGGISLERSSVCAPNSRILSPLPAGVDATGGIVVSPDVAGGVHLTWTETTTGNPETSRVRSIYEPAPCLMTFVPVQPTRACNEFGFNTDPVRTIAAGGAAASDASADLAGNLLVGYAAADGSPSVAVVDREIPRITGATAEQGSAPLKVRLSLTATETYSPPITVSWLVSHPNADGETQTKFFASGATTEVIVPDPPKGISVRGSVIATVRDAAGNTATLSRRLPLRADASPTPTPTPVAFSAKLGAKRFKALRSGAAVDTGKVKAGRGAKLEVTSAAAGTATLKLAVRTKGRKRGATCSTKARSGKRCAAYVTVRGSERVKLRAGTSTLRLTGRWRKRTLKPGTYRMTLTMPGAAKPVTVAFRITR